MSKSRAIADQMGAVGKALAANLARAYQQGAAKAAERAMHARDNGAPVGAAVFQDHAARNAALARVCLNVTMGGDQTDFAPYSETEPS